MADTKQDWVIGLDVGGTNIVGGLIDSDGQIIARTKIDTEARGGAEHVIARIADSVQTLLQDAQLKPRQIAAVGVGIPGAVDVEKGVVLNAVNLHWQDFQFVKPLRKAIGIPVVLDNDVNVGAWGEYTLGKGKDSRAMLAVFVGTGIGAGLVFNGELWRGPFGTAGEIGHMVIDVHGPLGGHTLEQLASRTAIVNRLSAMVQAGSPSQLPELAGRRWPHIRSKVLARAWEGRDELTVAVLSEAAEILGTAIASVVTLLSLDCVVLGGGLTEAMDQRWIKLIRDSFEQHVFPSHLHKARVVAGSLGDDAGIVGAAMLARQRMAEK